MNTTNKTKTKKASAPEKRTCVHCDDTATHIVNEQPICGDCDENLYEPAQQPQPADQWKQWAMSYKAHADKLAEAMKSMISLVEDLGVTTSTTRDNAKQALAEYQNALHGGQAAGGE